MSRRIAILGTSQFGEQLLCAFEDAGFGTVAGWLDDYLAPGTMRYERPVLGGLGDAAALRARGAFDEVAMGVGYKHRRFRREAFERLRAAGVPWTTFVHPTALLERRASVGEGAILLPRVTVGLGAQVGENVLLHTACTISHDCRIGPHGYLSPCCALAGHVTVGPGCFLGIGTVVVNSVRIGANVQTGAGAVVTRDTPDDVLMVGVPAVVKKAAAPS